MVGRGQVSVASGRLAGSVMARLLVLVFGGLNEVLPFTRIGGLGGFSVGRLSGD
jgi:hypothetical protein